MVKLDSINSSPLTRRINRKREFPETSSDSHTRNAKSIGDNGYSLPRIVLQFQIMLPDQLLGHKQQRGKAVAGALGHIAAGLDRIEKAEAFRCDSAAGKQMMPDFVSESKPAPCKGFDVGLVNGYYWRDTHHVNVEPIYIFSEFALIDFDPQASGNPPKINRKLEFEFFPGFMGKELSFCLEMKPRHYFFFFPLPPFEIS